MREQQQSDKCLWTEPGPDAVLGVSTRAAPAQHPIGTGHDLLAQAAEALADSGSRSGKSGLAVFLGWLD